MAVTPSIPTPGIQVRRHVIVGTAGHIDHGKTSLVRALTGTDTDRLPEEQRRGMTIELGFAEMTIGHTQFGVVDVPGHERFVRTMVAGATGIDIAVLVVAADDSVMPQTVEHVEILNLLGVAHGVVAVTKIDTVEESMIELVVEEVSTLLSGTSLESAAVCPVSSITGAGLEALKQAILEASGNVVRVPATRPFRLAVDRVFTVQGRGTVVTGSVLRGSVSPGDTLEVWPGGETCRARDLQTHGSDAERLGRGQRAAINVSGISRERLARGCELATPGYLKQSSMIDVRLRYLRTCDRPLRSTRTVRLGMGTVEVPVRVVLLEGPTLEPGATAYAQLRSGEPITATYGQRFIIRDENAARTLGGGVVLRPVAQRKRLTSATEIAALSALDQGSAEDRVEQVLRSAGFSMPTDLQLCARAGVELDELPTILERLRAEKRWLPIEGTDTYAVPAAVSDLTHRLSGWLERHHRNHPEQPGRPVDSVLGWLERTTSRALARPLLDRLVRLQAVKLLGRFVCLPAFAPALSAADEKLMAGMLEEIRAAGAQPPSLEGLSLAPQADRKRWERLATLAVALGELVQVEPKMYLHVEAERRLRETVAQLIGERGAVTVAEVREALGSTRKYVVPFLEYLDRVGFTERIEDRRVLAATHQG